MTGNEDHRISLQEAAELTRNFRETPLGSIASTLAPVTAEAFSKSEIEALLAQTGAVGVRIYYGLELLPDPKFRLIIVGVNSSDDDLTSGIILDHGTLCPPVCSTDNDLNS